MVWFVALDVEEQPGRSSQPEEGAQMKTMDEMEVVEEEKLSLCGWTRLRQMLLTFCWEVEVKAVVVVW